MKLYKDMSISNVIVCNTIVCVDYPPSGQKKVSRVSCFREIYSL